MSSYPTRNYALDDIKIRYLEPYASQALDKRFMGLPLGVYEGYTPSVASPLLTLATSLRGLSLLRLQAGPGRSSIDLILEQTITLDFTAHDFTLSGDLYVIATATYNLGSTTTARIVTRATPPVGNTEIGICRVSGTGAPGVMTVFQAVTPDRHTPLATGANPYGFMAGGSVEALAAAGAMSGRMPYDPVVRIIGFPLTSTNINKVILFDFIGLGASTTFTFPPSAGLTDGARVAFLSLTGVAPAHNYDVGANIGDAVMYQGAPVAWPASVPAVRKSVGHFFMYELVKTSFATPRWYLTADVLPQLHAALHQAGGTDQIKLDDLALPDDNTDLNASITRHGLLKKLPNVSTEFLNGVGNFSNPSVVALGGYPGGMTNFLREDATFQPPPALNTDGIVRILSTTTGIDMNVLATTPLYVVPVGKTAIITGYVSRPTVIVGAVTRPQVSLGVSPSTTDVSPSNVGESLTQTVGNATYVALRRAGGSAAPHPEIRIAVAGTTIQLTVTVVDGGPTHIATVDLMGYLI